ncbi:MULTISPECIES: Gfo/Idh/MocA family protein [Pacificibacter]|uniref:Gfo/Idh/MocA family protein n=1 Tax=Pacificibacter TaxID=1042323 RepID=UPI001C08782B|nr:MULTISPECIES: Gfo/Idh/MocA family oxidoreductase [Pacificibacter]MBU2937139.1 Gfo/Idh/MocA family oxidoreductase [Pacificibacter marinus]MDO6616448.1 Gfo/Idh/MocA family oxidoreductase [Pacificibacter sp. 1_MG-2023]
METIRFAALGMDHRHIYGMSQGMIDVGAQMAGWWTHGDPQPIAGFMKRFPDAPRFDDLDEILDDPSISLVLIACRPDQRADLAIKAMRAGKDVMVDKPGCISLDEVQRLRMTVRDTGRIWSVNFSERFEVPAVTVATELVRSGAIGEVIHTTGLGPHRLNAQSRPDWFFDAATYGGILTDIASHQIEQFLHFTGHEDAEITMATVGNHANPDHPKFEDFGTLSLRAGTAQAFIRVDWYTADALPNWGDGRLFITGTEGSIELRKYVDVDGRSGDNHLFLVNKDTCKHFDCTNADLPYFQNLLNDVIHRTQTACPQERTFRVCELAVTAQTMAQDTKL